ncbi:hypothetical protein [Plantactinospora sp. WMMB782]|uniref:hypothetical protein n=1 Tax=Plantactinospora sp. WMMB782 TaxID=3404121 RepID=UPI003B935110
MSEKIIINLEKARELVDKAIERHGEGFVYNESSNPFTGCYYIPQPERFDADDPRSEVGCLVGTAFTLGGFTGLPEASDIGANELDEWISGPNGERVELDDEAEAFLQATQEHQDGGSTWGEARQHGNDEIAELHEDESDEG